MLLSDSHHPSFFIVPWRSTGKLWKTLRRRLNWNQTMRATNQICRSRKTKSSQEWHQVVAWEACSQGWEVGIFKLSIFIVGIGIVCTLCMVCSHLALIYDVTFPIRSWWNGPVQFPQQPRLDEHGHHYVAGPQHAGYVSV